MPAAAEVVADSTQVEVPALLRRRQDVAALGNNHLLGQTGQPFCSSESRTISSRTRCESGWLESAEEYTRLSGNNQ